MDEACRQGFGCDEARGCSWRTWSKLLNRSDPQRRPKPKVDGTDQAADLKMTYMLFHVRAGHSAAAEARRRNRHFEDAR
jgi:hypothetical protein